jgi:hypothetical protein
VTQAPSDTPARDASARIRGTEPRLNGPLRRRIWQR